MGEERGHGQVGRHTVLNLIGQGAPLVAAVFAIPVIAHALGAERFGMLTIAWSVLGYFGIFDFGLGRALTALVAIAAERRDDDRLARLVWSCLAAMVPLGLVAGAAGALLAPLLARHLLVVSPAARAETLTAFYLVAAAIPAVIVTTGLRGVLEGIRRFDLANALRLPMGLATFLAPLAMLPFSRRLGPIVGALLAARLIGLVAYLAVVLHAAPALRRSLVIGRAELRELLHVGSWMTVSNVLTPLLDEVDRFVIGALVSMSAVAYYAAPYEAITRVLMLPAAAATALFPAFSARYSSDREGVARLYRRWLRAVGLGLLPVVLFVVLFAHEILQLWLGAEYAAQSTTVLRILAVGVLANSFAYLAYTLVQAVGRPDLTAKLHLAELPVYALLIWSLVPRFGIVGVAATWTLRCALDTAVLCALARNLLRARGGSVAQLSLAVLAVAALLGAATLPMSLAMRALFLLLALGALAALAWRYALEEEDRAKFRAWRRRAAASV